MVPVPSRETAILCDFARAKPRRLLYISAVLAMRGWRGKWGRRVTGMLERRGLTSQGMGEGVSRASGEGWAGLEVE